MRAIVVGLGVQGKKRILIAGEDVVATVDPYSPEASHNVLSDVPLPIYDAALVATPDETKFEICSYLLSKGKHVMVEKPLFLHPHEIKELEDLSITNNVLLYTAYNHRFEPHFQKTKNLLDKGDIGQIYSCRIFYGNGTARLVRESLWRDQGSGVLNDLGSHLLDTLDFWFGDINIAKPLVRLKRFENLSPDYAQTIFTHDQIHISLEMSLCSWKNTFECDIVGSLGSIHIRGLCKWGESHLVHRKRKLPSGIPIEHSFVEPQGDPTWALEYRHFCDSVNSKLATSLAKDLRISAGLLQLSKLGDL